MAARASLLLLALITALVSAVSAPPAVSANGFIVTKTADTNDGVCDFDCSLREAIVTANATAGADTITLPAGTYKLAIAGAGEDAGATGDLDITDDLTIAGAGRRVTFIDGTPSDTGAVDRVLDVAPTGSVTVSISGVTVQRGVTGGHGAGVRNQGALTMTDSRVRWNSTTGAGRGGGVYHDVDINDGSLTLIRTIVDDNHGAFGGGGVYIDRGTATITDSSIGWNTASSRGGGIHARGDFENSVFDSIALTVTGSTINNNTASGAFTDGGGILSLRQPDDRDHH